MKREEFYQSPLVGFILVEVMEGTNELYVGFENIFGNWIIKKITNNDSTFRYAYGSSDFTSAWNGRLSLTYTLPSQAFGLLVT